MSGAIEPLLAPAREALRQGDAARALGLLDALPASGAAALPVQLDRALALRLLGRLPEAVSALDAVLAIEPYHLLAILSKGALVERMGHGKDAARIYANALAFAPPSDQLPKPLAAQLDHARQVVRQDGEKLKAALETAAAGLTLTAREKRRFEEAADIAAGLKTPFRQEPLLLNFPQLPAIPFHDEAQFPWLAELEAATEVIAAEYLKAMEELAGAFAPYVEYPKGVPVNQWGELNHSRRWSAMFLWKDGARQDGACEQCPRTAELLDRLPLARQPGFAPTVVFSVLDAKTHIPPHTGSTNARALVHLPLVLPGPARFRVGNETRDWKMGQAWVFDDTIEHEAWNDAEVPRTIMILDVWNPYLSDVERSLASAMLAARKAYYQG
jgi:aspartyl/asparaginyl beta-hydroxylase (cupin superfamily)